MKRLITIISLTILLPIIVQAKIEYPKAIEYFNEIALKSEYGGEDSEGIIRKWEEDLNIYVMGNFTKEDYNVLIWHVEFLNSIDGMPKISFVKDINLANVTIYFLTQWEISKKTNLNEIIWGYARCFWNEKYEINAAEIYIVYDKTNQKQRKHVILEELTQSLGLMNDSLLYEDSIFHNEYSEKTSLSYIDKLLIRMLYSSSINPGMSGKEISDIIEAWYSCYYN